MRVFVKSFGCSTNLADGQVLAGCLSKARFEIARSASTADVVVCNTCAVKEPTENRMISILKKVPSDKKLVVVGCLPLINFDRLSKEVRFDAVAGPALGSRIVELVERVLSNEKVVWLQNADDSLPKLGLPRIRQNRVISIIPISYGCLGSCAYCCVTHARGRLRSYGIAEVTEKVKNDFAEGALEFWLTSQDTACYGKDKNANLAELLNSVCKVEGNFKVRVGMMTPNMALEILDGLVKALSDERVFKFVHLPVQSGDDEVLRGMNRRYTVEDFLKVVGTFRRSFPELTLSTDIICGFPGETEKAFENTLRLLREVKPDVVNVSKFFARPRTAAARMQGSFVSPSEIKRRSVKAAKLARKVSFEGNERWVRWAGEILIDEAGKVRGTWVGRNFAYKPFVVRGGRGLFGETVKVKAAEAFPTCLRGELLG